MSRCESCHAELPEDAGPLCAKCQAEREERDSRATIDEPAVGDSAGGDSTGGDSTANEPTVGDGTIGGDDGATIFFDSESHTNPGPVAEAERRGQAPTLHGSPPGELTVDLDGGPRTDPGDGNMTRQESLTPGPFVSSDHADTVDLDRKIKRMWGAAESSDGSPSGTLQVELSHLAGESLLSVSSRPVAYPDAAPNDKADYRVEKFVAKGGMGRVYLAQQTSLGRTVALKTLADDLAQKERYRRKFFAEASITGLLDHPNIVPIHDLGVRGDGVPFYSMKFVTGEPWSDSIGKRTKSEDVAILLRVADAVAFAHSRKILHRDLKPENVMLGEYGEVLVVDWGLAIHLERDKEFSLGGTPLYMAPEMANHDVPLIGVRSDVYLLGAILYEVLEGKAPHASGGKTATERLLVAAMNQIQPHESADELIDVALKAMSTNPSDRYADVLEFQAAIRECQRHADSRERSERARQELAEAKKTGKNELYARSLFAYQDAIDLWPENHAAAEGLHAARLAYAEHALEQQDYALGLSLLDPDDPQHAPLRERLLDAQQQEQQRGRRLKFARRAAVLASLAAIGTLTGFAFFAHDAASKQKVLTQKERESAAEAILQKGIAEKNAEDAKKQAIEANDARLKEQSARLEAEKAKGVALDAKNKAEEARDAQREAREEADQQRGLAKQSEEKARHRAFVAELALTTADLAVADTDTASERLAKIESDYPTLLDWEADRLRFLCHRDFARQELGAGLQAVAVSDEGDRIVALVGGKRSPKLVGARVTDSGFVVEGEIESQIASPAVLAFGPGGRLAVGGVAPGGDVAVEIGRIDDPADSRLIRSPDPRRQITALAFSPSGGELAVAHHAPLSVRIEMIDAASPPATLDDSISSPQEYALAGVGSFTGLAFSRDGRRLAAVERSRGASPSNVTVWSRPTGAGPFTDKTKLEVEARCVAIHPVDNRLIACGAAGGELVLWRLPPRGGDAPRQIERYDRHADDLRSLHFSSDGRSLVTAAESGVALVWRRTEDPLVWDVDNRPPVRHLSALRGAAWSGGDRTLVTADAEGLLRAWPLDRFYNVRRTQTAAGAEATSVAAGRVGDSGRQGEGMIVGDAGGHTRLFDPQSPHTPQANQTPLADFFIGHPGEGHAHSWKVNAGGRQATATLGFHRGEATLCRWDDESRTVVRGVGEKDMVDLSPDGQTLVVANLRDIRLIRVSDSRVLASGGTYVSSIAYLPSGRIAVGDARGRVSIMEVNGDELDIAVSETITPRREVRRLAAPRFGSIDEDVVYASAEGAKPEVYRVAFTAGAKTMVSTTPAPPAAVRRLEWREQTLLAECGDANELFALASDGSSWAPTGQEVFQTGVTERRPILLAYPSPSGKGRIEALSDDGSLRVWSPRRPRQPESSTRLIADGETIVAAALGGDFGAACLVAAGDSGVRALVRPAAGAEWRALNTPGDKPLSENATCAIGAGRVVLWDASQARLMTWPLDLPAAAPVLSTAEGATPAAGPLPVAIDPTGRVATAAASGAGEQRLLLWHSQTEPPRGVGLDQTTITSLRFSPSGDRLLAGADSGRILVFDVSVTTGADDAENPRTLRRLDELITFAEHRRPVTTMRFSPSGETLMSGDRQGEAIWWPTAKGP